VSAGPTRWAVLKNPAHLSTGQRTTIAAIRRTNGPLYRAYLIKEQLREAFHVKGEHGRRLLTGVISWAQRSRLPEMEKLARTLKTYRTTINNSLDSGVSNARVEATNTPPGLDPGL
jgi:transposase